MTEMKNPDLLGGGDRGGGTEGTAEAANNSAGNAPDAQERGDELVQYRLSQDRIDQMPAPLRKLRQFVVFRVEERDGRRTKVPYRARNQRASTTDSSTWLMFDAAHALYEFDPAFDGIGIVFSKDDPYAGVDLDHCFDENGVLRGWAIPIVDFAQELGCYIEYSPSRRGLHIIGRGELASGHNKRGVSPDDPKSGVEGYSFGRYFTMTGDQFGADGNADANMQPLLDHLERLYWSDASDAAPVEQGMPISDDDADDLVAEFLGEARDDTRSLWNDGDEKSKFESQSQARFGLLVRIAMFLKERATRSAVKAVAMRAPLIANDRRDKWPRLAADECDKAIREARKHLAEAASRGSARAQPGAEAASLILVTGSAITPEPVEWLWQGYLARGKLGILGGSAGTGKTTSAIALAATATVGGRWPDGQRATASDVLIVSLEDDVADTLAPRLIAAGADMSRVHFVAGVQLGGNRQVLNVAAHAEQIEQAIRDTGAQLLILDPIVSVLGAFDSHKNVETRQALQPLADIAMRTGVAMLGITHFSKGSGGREPLERLTGSLAFGALARIAFCCERVVDDAGVEQRVFLRIKSNIGPDGGGFAYALEQVNLPGLPGISASRVLWGKQIAGAARDILKPADDGEESALGEAKAFLREVLQDGAVLVRQIEASAKSAGIAWRTVQRAKAALGVEAVKDGLPGGWIWQFPVKNAKDAKCP